MTLAQAHQEPDDTNGNQRTPANPLFPSNSAPSPSPYAPPHFQGHLTLLPGLHLATPFEDHEVNLLAQKILRISIAIFVWSSLNTIIRLILEVTVVDTNVVSIIAANLVVIALGAIILAVGIKGVKARNEPCHCCCCATWLDAYKVLTIVQIVFCSFDLILSAAAVVFGGAGFALINVAYFTILLSMLVTCLNACNRLLSLLRGQHIPMEPGVQMVATNAGMVPASFSYPPPPTYIATVYADRGDDDDDDAEPEPVTGLPVPGYPVSSTGAPFSPSEAMMQNLIAPPGFHQTAPQAGNSSGGCS